ncbi:unnamed protein product [Trichobilharzia szidati]|nr:unnamed protein product [Trichobilharzia szidati]
MVEMMPPRKAEEATSVRSLPLMVIGAGFCCCFGCGSLVIFITSVFFVFTFSPIFAASLFSQPFCFSPASLRTCVTLDINHSHEKSRSSGVFLSQVQRIPPFLLLSSYSLTHT